MMTANEVRLEGSEAHHATVLRLEPGEKITVSDNNGRTVMATVTAVTASDVVATTDFQLPDTTPPMVVTLWQSIVKDGLDEILRQATELGIRGFRPFVSARTIPRWNADKAERNTERLRAVALSAAKQCRCPRVPVVHPVAKGPDPNGNGPVFVLDPEAEIGLVEALPAQMPRSLELVVGPEGSLSPDEIRALADGGAQAVHIGPQIFRSVTAATVALSVIFAHYGVIG